jgi:hypothetical protein
VPVYMVLLQQSRQAVAISSASGQQQMLHVL